MTVLLAAAFVAAAQPCLIAPPAPPAPPPVITYTAPPAPPAPPSPAVYQRMAARLAQPPAILDVRVSGEGGLLWEGTLRVGASSAMINQSRTEAQPASCPREAMLSERSVHTTFSLNLSPSFYSEEPDLYSVSVGWTRLPDGNACARDGTRTVQLQTTIRIAEHNMATLHGDAGLIVEIRRR
jgi:hypothetical protein